MNKQQLIDFLTWCVTNTNGLRVEEVVDHYLASHPPVTVTDEQISEAAKILTISFGEDYHETKAEIFARGAKWMKSKMEEKP